MKGFRLFLVIVLCGAAPAGAQAGVLEFLFPKYNESEYDPSKTLQAPFAVERNEKGMPLLPSQPNKNPDLPQNAIALNLPHRNVEMIGEWVMMTVSEAMTFEPGGTAAHAGRMAQYFNPAAKAQYDGFLAAHKMDQYVQSGRYQIRSFVQEKPLLLNQGAANGAYRWLFEVPVTVSYLPAGKVQYKEVEAINQFYVLTVQIGRAAAAQNDDAIWIESWAGRAAGAGVKN